MSTGLEKEYESEHVRRIIRLTGGTGGAIDPRKGKVSRILYRSAETISRDIRKFRTRHPQGSYKGNFFKFNAQMEKQITGTLRTLHDDVETSIEDAMVNQWELCNKKNNGVVERYVKGMAVPNTVMRSMNLLNIGTMNAFIARTERGMNLSNRVWTLTGDIKTQLEEYLASGITTGRSADKISRDIRMMLKEPKKLFRRVRNEQGKLVLSKAAKAYHPGGGIYQSSYKNARRLAVTETNMAYRMSDVSRRGQLPFVKAIIVHLSNAHPRTDICDSMTGEYPRTFIFGGWHPHCLCYTTTKLMKRAEFKEYLRTGKIARGTHVTGIPVKAKTFLRVNKPKIDNWKNKPYWLKDNFNSNGDLKTDIVKSAVPKQRSRA